jgi:CheY-like chemotaxis protein
MKVDTLSLFLWKTDASRRLIWGNEPARALWGADSAEWLHSLHSEDVATLVRQVLYSKPPFSGEFRLQHQGETLLIAFIAQPEENGGLLWSGMDISHHFGRLQTLEVKASLESTYRQFFFAQKHMELRQRLNALTGLFSLLGETALSERQANTLQAMKATLEQLNYWGEETERFVKRVSLHQVDVAQQPVSLVGLLEPLADTLNAFAQRNNNKLFIRYGASLPPKCLGPSQLLAQTLTLLIWCELAKYRNTHLFFSVEWEANEVSITMEAQDNATPVETTPLPELDLIEKALGLLNGSLERLKEGVTVFRFPLMAESLPDKPNPVKGRILVADEELLHRRSLVERLNAEGYQVEAAANSEELFERLFQANSMGNPFQTVILDRQLSGVDGFLLGQKIRSSHAGNPHILYFMSSPDDVSLRRGQTILYGKPFTQLRLTETLKTLSRQSFLAPKAPAQESNNHVLIVEDNPINQLVLLHTLHEMGLKTTMAHTGAEALEAIATTPFGLILLDCNLPDSDGFALARQIREKGNWQVPIVAMTHTSGIGNECMAAGMDDYLTKPLKTEELTAALYLWLKTSMGIATP